jgi:hypothetical protein
MLVVSTREAERVNLWSNAILAAKVTLANEPSESAGREFRRALVSTVGPDHLTVTPSEGLAGYVFPMTSTPSSLPHPLLLQRISGLNKRVRRYSSVGVCEESVVGQFLGRVHT